MKNIILLLATFLLFNCSSSSNTSSNRIDNTYKLELGVLAGDKVDDFLNQLTQRYSFELARRENTSNVSGFYAETYFRDRQPLTDEKAQGIDKVYNKIIIRGSLIRNRTSSLSMTDIFYDVKLEIKQEAKKINNENILPFNFTDEGYDFTKDLAYNLKDMVQGRMIQ